MTLLRPARFHGDYLGIVNLGASATLQLHSSRSGQLQVWFKCSPEVCVALLNSRTNSTLSGSIPMQLKNPSNPQCSYLKVVIVPNRSRLSANNHRRTLDHLVLYLRLTWTSSSNIMSMWFIMASWSIAN